VNVEAQQQNPYSLLWWMRRVLALRKRWRALGQGTLQFLQPENRKVLAFVRHYEQERILIVANLSRFPQPVNLELGSLAGTVPMELFGQTDFPAITDKPYSRTLSPHALFWFRLEARSAQATVRGSSNVPSEPTVGKAEQSNTALIVNDKFFLKIFRRLEAGVNPDLEIGRFLTERHFPNIAPTAGALEYVRSNGDQISLGIMSQYLPAAKDAWQHTLDTLSRYFERVRALPQESRIDPLTDGSILELA
jgi:Maltogenic Amylase, C-terminal domain